MLAAVGFIVTGICFAIFAYTFTSYVVKSTTSAFKSFPVAYYCLAAAFAVWGIASVIGDVSVLAWSVIIGDVLLLLGTLSMLAVLGGRWRTLLLISGLFVTIALLALRVGYLWPDPYMQGDILYFNTPLSVGMVLTALFVLVWLPINVYVARRVAHAIGQDGLATIYSWIYGAATVASVVFVSARRPVTVILSFASIGACFVMLIASNMLVQKLKEPRHARRK